MWTIGGGGGGGRGGGGVRNCSEETEISVRAARVESTRIGVAPPSARVASGWRMTSGENRTMNDTLALA